MVGKKQNTKEKKPSIQKWIFDELNTRATTLVKDTENIMKGKYEKEKEPITKEVYNNLLQETRKGLKTGELKLDDILSVEKTGHYSGEKHKIVLNKKWNNEAQNRTKKAIEDMKNKYQKKIDKVNRQYSKWKMSILLGEIERDDVKEFKVDIYI